MLLTAAGYPLIIVTISRLALREGSDTLTREQLAELPQNSNNTVAVLWLMLAFIIVPILAQMVIDNAGVLARYFGMSDLIVGLTILTIVTNLPELATLVAGALKGENDIALENVIGSNTLCYCAGRSRVALSQPVQSRRLCQRLLGHADGEHYPRRPVPAQTAPD